MRTALVLGGAACLHEDIDAYDGPVDGVVACNEAGAEWAGELDAWVSLHPLYFRKKGWRKKRKDRGYPDAKRHMGHPEAFRNKTTVMKWMDPDVEAAPYRMTEEGPSGSSGLYAAKVALVDLGFDRIVLCGIPMTATPHFFDAAPWDSARSFQRAWLHVPIAYRKRMRSMSGWTRVLLGAPEANGGTECSTL